MTTYIGLTIGPIYKTFSEANRTRAVWASSYFFSWFMRNVLEKAKDQNLNIFLPYAEDFFKGTYGAGLYADRIYFIKDEHTTIEKINNIIQLTFNEIESLSGKTIDINFLSNYLNLHVVEKTISDDELIDNFPLAILNNILDNKELHQNYNFDFESNPLQTYFSNNINADNSFIAKDAFNDNKRKFKSITEIATQSFNRISAYNKTYNKTILKDLKSKEDTNLIDEFINAELPILPHHKYFAVIYADGDDIGKLIKAIDKQNKDIKQFSKTLFEFGLKAETTIANYGGSGIYLGGEDILIFAPIACIDKENETVQNTVFNLIELLDNDFKNTVQQYCTANNLAHPTLSYGVKISYYKYPLKEAMNEAHKLLDDKAKAKTKNTIAINFQKHSGQLFEAIIQKNKKTSLHYIYSIVNTYCIQPKNIDKTNEILSSIIQKFRDNNFKKLFVASIENNTLDAFFKNNFNEGIHQSSTFLDDVKELAQQVFTDDADDEMLACENIYLILRFIHFINSTKEY